MNTIYQHDALPISKKTRRHNLAPIFDWDLVTDPPATAVPGSYDEGYLGPEGFSVAPVGSQIPQVCPEKSEPGHLSAPIAPYGSRRRPREDTGDGGIHTERANEGGLETSQVDGQKSVRSTAVATRWKTKDTRSGLSTSAQYSDSLKTLRTFWLWVSH